MSGHSKWANIKNKKAKTDAAKGKIFTKIGRELAVAAKQGADPSTNSKLADVIAKAKAANMPNDNIQRSIKKASGELNAVNYEETSYEGYGVGGSAVIVKCLTDNKNRTAGDVRHAFDKHGGSLGALGCVSYLFDNKGLLILENTPSIDEEQLIDMCLEAEAEDVVNDGDVYQIITAPSDFNKVKEALEAKGLTFLQAEVTMIPQSNIDLDANQLATFTKMIDTLEALDDVQDVYHNVNMPEEENED